jgi:hypothetical protein
MVCDTILHFYDENKDLLKFPLENMWTTFANTKVKKSVAE